MHVHMYEHVLQFNAALSVSGAQLIFYFDLVWHCVYLKYRVSCYRRDILYARNSQCENCKCL